MPGVDRTTVYVTNAVKHFKFVRTPKRRLHQTPNSAEIGACRPWLLAELAILEPRVLVCLGASASKALLGDAFRITRDRGRFVEERAVQGVAHIGQIVQFGDQAAHERRLEILEHHPHAWNRRDRLARPPLQDAGAMILDLQPITHIHAIAVHRKGFLAERLNNHERDEFLRELIRAVVVRTSRHQNLLSVGFI